MLHKCCCCIPLRTGSIIIGVVGILGGISLLIRISVISDIESDWNEGLKIYCPDIVASIIILLVYGCLLFGAIQYFKGAVLVYLIFGALFIVVSVIFRIYSIARLKGGDRFQHVASLMFYVLFSMYFWICNYSFYVELKKERGILFEMSIE